MFCRNNNIHQNRIGYVICICFIFVVAMTAFANADQRTIKVAVDGAEVVFGDQKPIIVEGRTLVPIREVFEAIGFHATWDPQTSVATLSKSGYTVSIASDAKTFTVNGQTVTPDVPQQIVNGKLMLPLRAVAEATKMDVAMDTATNTITIDSPGRIIKVSRSQIAGEIGNLGQREVSEQRMFEAYDKVVSVINQIITENMTDYEKEKAIHDYLASNVRYDDPARDKSEIKNGISRLTTNEWRYVKSYTYYGAIMDHLAVCQGYSEAMSLFMTVLGIDNQIVYNRVHAWNMIKIDGEWYHVDVTLDSTNGLGRAISYTYFNTPTDFMKREGLHVYDVSKYPTATSEKYYYLRQIAAKAKACPIVTTKEAANQALTANKKFIMMGVEELMDFDRYFDPSAAFNSGAFVYLIEQAEKNDVKIIFIDNDLIFANRTKEDTFDKYGALGQLYTKMYENPEVASISYGLAFSGIIASINGGTRFSIDDNNAIKEIDNMFSMFPEN